MQEEQVEVGFIQEWGEKPAPKKSYKCINQGCERFNYPVIEDLSNR